MRLLLAWGADPSARNLEHDLPQGLLPPGAPGDQVRPPDHPHSQHHPQCTLKLPADREKLPRIAPGTPKSHCLPSNPCCYAQKFCCCTPNILLLYSRIFTTPPKLWGPVPGPLGDIPKFWGRTPCFGALPEPSLPHSCACS